MLETGTLLARISTPRDVLDETPIFHAVTSVDTPIFDALVSGEAVRLAVSTRTGPGVLL